MKPTGLPTMTRVFLTVAALGLVSGALAPLVAMAFAHSRHVSWAYVATSVGLGFAYAVAMYVYLKTVLRAFVRRLHAIERVVAGTVPPELPGVWVSDEIVETEKSAARIVAKLDAARAAVADARVSA